MPADRLGGYRPIGVRLDPACSRQRPYEVILTYRSNPTKIQGNTRCARAEMQDRRVAGRWLRLSDLDDGTARKCMSSRQKFGGSAPKRDRTAEGEFPLPRPVVLLDRIRRTISWGEFDYQSPRIDFKGDLCTEIETGLLPRPNVRPVGYTTLAMVIPLIQLSVVRRLVVRQHHRAPLLIRFSQLLLATWLSCCA
jgi:hypothetical protein